MADYYTQFSVGIGNFPPEQLAWARDLHEAISMHFCNGSEDLERDRRWNELADDARQAALAIMAANPDDLSKFEIESSRAYGDDGQELEALYVHGEEGGLDNAALFIQQVLIHSGSTEPVMLEWANSCSKPRVDAFGGGAMVITQDRILSCSTRDMVERLLDQIGIAEPDIKADPSPSP